MPIETWLQFALQQMAAESYLDGIDLNDNAQVETRLLLGNNRLGINSPNEILTGATRFTNSLADQFVDRYQVVDHHANDATGFSATLTREIGTNNFTLSFRSTEYPNQVDGGDYERDGANLPLLTGADGEIVKDGFAFGQLAGMEHYYQTIVKPLLPEGALLNVTGYSLGAHLATVFTELHGLETDNPFSFGHTYTFNGTGRGEFSGGALEETVESTRIRTMLSRLTQILNNPMAGLPDGMPEELWPTSLNAALLAWKQDPTWDPWTYDPNKPDGSVYTDSRYLWAKQVVGEEFSPVSRIFSNITRTDGAFSLITQVVGHATQGDSEYAANRGNHAQETRVYIEDQPDLDRFLGFFGASGAYGTTHSITLIVDSLATQEFFQTIAPSITQSEIEAIFAAVSNQTAFGFVGAAGVAEGNSLENALDALGKLLVPNYISTQFGRQTGDFGSPAFRNPYYEHLAAIRAAVPNGTVTIEPLVTLPTATAPGPVLAIPADVLGTRAQAETDRGVAYRYALNNLNPFAVVGVDYAALGHTSDGELSLYDSTTGSGEMTERYLIDRAAFLEQKLALNLLNDDTSSGNIHFKDFASGGLDIPTTIDGHVDQEYLFGSDAGDRLFGDSADDELFGGGGDDELIGKGGADYLEGNAGNDVLVGGTGDNDLLVGGVGFDTYIYNTGDGTDRIEDTHGQNGIIFDQQLLQGGIRPTNGNTYTSPDGRFVYVFSGTDLVVNGSLVLNHDFQNGEFGIRLIDLPSYENGLPNRTVFLKTVSNPAPPPSTIEVPFFDAGDNDSSLLSIPMDTDMANNFVHGLGGNDFIVSGAGNDEIYGDEENDEIYGGLGDDRLYGGPGNDQLLGDNVAVSPSGGNDYLDGGDGDDFVQGGAGRDVVFGGAGNDQLNGDEFAGDNSGSYDDYLDGGNGDDFVHGGAGSDVLLGGGGNDQLVGDATQYQNGTAAVGGNDTLDGGAGNDQLFGVFGDDVLSGGSGNDLINGQDGSDVLYGGADNDLLSGDLRVVSLVPWGGDNFTYVFDTNEYHGAGDDDLLYGDDGNDILIGGEGNDTLVGGSGADTLIGGYDMSKVAVSDPLFWTLFTIEGTDWIDAGTGNDVVHGSNGNDTLYGGEGDDGLTGNGGDDVLIGGADNDRLFGDYLPNQYLGSPFWNDIMALGGNNRLEGGAGDDELWGGDKDDILLGGEGNDNLHGMYGKDQLWGGEGNDILQDDQTYYAGTGDDDFLDGGAGDDSLIFVSGNNNVLHGGPGNDRLTAAAYRGTGIMYGEDGNDVLDSGMIGEAMVECDTIMIGGAGDDSYYVDSLNDVVIEEVGAGIDTIISFVPYTLPDYVENFSQLSGQFVTGNGLDNEIWGNNYEFNVIDGRAGADTMHGRFGDDTYIVDNIGDVVIEDNVWDGTDIVQSSITFALPIYVEHLILTGSQAVDGIGNAADNSLTGNNAANTLAGGQGNDGIHGGLGDDTYLFNIGDGIDTIEDIASAAEGNRIQFGAGIAQADLGFSQTGTTLEILVGSGGDRVRLHSFDPSNANGSLVVSTLQFANGGIINLADLFPTSVNHAPAVANLLTDQSVPEDTPFTIQIPANTFADEDTGDVLTYSAALVDGNALPTWLTFDSTTKTFNGMPDDAQVGSWDLRVTVKDSGDLTVSDVFTLTVNGVNEAPIAAMPITDQQAMEDTLFNFVMPAGTFTDVDGGDILTYSATLANGDALPAWLGFDASTGSFSGIPTNSDVGTANIDVKATDLAGLGVTNSFTLTIQNVNDAPIVANALADQGAAEDSPFSLRIPSTTFDDVDIAHGDQLIYSVAQADGSALPTWLSFEADSQTLAGTPGPGNAGLLQIAVTATDTMGTSVTDQFALTVSGPLPKILTGTAGNDALTGGRGDDILSGLSGNDQLIGREGDDLLDGGAGSDTMQGGPGNDTYLVDNSGDAVTENANEGIDTVQSSVTYTLGAHLENLTLTGTAAINGTGNALNNALVGNSANNRLSGGAGNDRIDGGAGSDTMLGGTGNDTYIVNQVGDVVTENFNEGMDTVESGISYTLGSNVENLTLTGTAQMGTGNVLNNILTGNGGNNVLDGGAANDTVDGGAGNDSLLGGSGDDLLLGGLGDDALAAGSGNDVLDGGDGTDTLDAGAGDDILRGGAGDDSLTGGSGGDQLLGGLGNDMLIGGSGNDLYSFSRGDGQDTLLDSDLFPSNQDRLLFGTTIDPLDLVLSSQANDLHLAIHGTSDVIRIQNWYTSPTTNQIEDLRAGNGQHLLNTQVDQLIQAMASFSQQTGLTWDQAIDQRPQEVQTVLAASWH